MDRELYIPPSNDFNEANVWSWYQNLAKELQRLDLCATEQQYIEDYYKEAGLLLPARKGFFRQHYSKTFFQAASFLLEGMPNKVVLDLGAGTGSQSLFFAMQGAKVIALDLDGIALKILQRRKELYESETGRKLDIEIREQNAFDLELPESMKVGAVYSMFAFNMMQPSDKLIDRLMSNFDTNVRLCVLDGNNRSWLSRIVPSRRRDVWSPEAFRQALEQRGFAIAGHSGGISLPPLFWRFSSFHGVLAALDAGLNRSWLFPISHQVMAQRIAKTSVSVE